MVSHLRNFIILIFSTLLTEGYNKMQPKHAVKETTKASYDRGAMIHFIVQGGYVLCREKCLSNLVRTVEVDYLPVGSDE